LENIELQDTCNYKGFVISTMHQEIIDSLKNLFKNNNRLISQSIRQLKRLAPSNWKLIMAKSYFCTKRNYVATSNNFKDQRALLFPQK